MTEEMVEVPARRRTRKKKLAKRAPRRPSEHERIAMHAEAAEKPSLGLPEPLEAAQEEARHAKEGSLKLQRAVDALRTALETIVIAEVDNRTGRPVTAQDLRGLAVSGLNAYSQITGQSWRRHKLVGNWAGDRSLDEMED